MAVRVSLTYRRRAASALARLLTDARRRMGVRQVDLAVRLERSQAYVSKYERGSRKVTLDEVAEICDALGVPLLGFLETWVRAIDEPQT